MHRWFCLLMLFLLLTACAAPGAVRPSPTTDALALPPAVATPTPCLARGPFPPRLAGLRYGVNAFLLGGDAPRTLTLAQTAGFSWMRQQIHWRDIEGRRGDFVWAPIDQAVVAARAHGLQVLLSIVRSAPWADQTGGLPDDSAAFGSFVAALAARYKGQVAAYEIWNEPNLAVENGGLPGTPAEYLATLAAAYPAIKASDPCALVVSAPLAATSSTDPTVATPDLPFLAQLYQLDGGAFLRLADLVGVHPGGGPYAPEEYWPADQPAASTHYFRHVERIHALMERQHDPRQVWITEVGWAVTAAPGAPPPVSEAKQAAYLLDALRLTREAYPWVSAIFVWNLNFAVLGSADDEKSSFGLLAADWSPRPAYLALQHELQRQNQQAARIAPKLSGAPPVVQGWVATMTGKARTIPVLAPDGTIYVGSDPGWLYAVDPGGVKRWSVKLPGGVRAAPALGADGTVYVLDDQAKLTALDPTGGRRWQQSLGAAAHGSPLILGGALYVAVDAAVVRLDHSGRAVWRAELGAPVNGIVAGHPAGGFELYATTASGALVALARDGRERWRVELGLPVVAAPAFVADTVLVGDSDGSLHARDAATGAPRWKHALVRRVLSTSIRPDTPVIAMPPLVAADGSIYLSGRDGSVTALDQTGQVRWRFASGSDLTATPTLLRNGDLAVSTLDERVIGLGQDGQQRWAARLVGSVRSTPAQAPDGTLYVTTVGGLLYALAPAEGVPTVGQGTAHDPHYALMAPHRRV